MSDSNRWISVEERLPERREEVLAYAELGATIAQYDGYGAFVRLDRYNDTYHGYLVTTHWQPLPEPPSEGGGS